MLVLREKISLLLLARSSGAFAAAGLLALLGLPQLAHAQTTSDDTTLRVTICNPADTTFDVTQPSNGATVETASVATAGSLFQISSIDVVVDGIYDHTVAVPQGATSFSDSVNISPGTHQLDFAAVSSCNATILTDTLMVTYSPKPLPPSAPNSPAATQPSSPSGSGALDRLFAEGVENTSGERPSGSAVTLPEVVGLLFADIFGALDFNSLGKVTLADGLRYSVFLSGLVLLLFGPQLAAALGVFGLLRWGLARRLAGWLRLDRPHRLVTWVIRVLGLLLIMLVAFGL